MPIARSSTAARLLQTGMNTEGGNGKRTRGRYSVGLRNSIIKDNDFEFDRDRKSITKQRA
jgi:hypothetical protein